MMMSQYVNIKSWNGKYFSISQYGKPVFEKNDIKESDILIMKYEGKYVTFRTKNGKYLSASQYGTLELDKEKVGSTERFEIEWINENSIALKSFYGFYISVLKDGKIELNQKILTGNEKMELIVEKVESLLEFLQF